jgi:hypothetical protein
MDTLPDQITGFMSSIIAEGLEYLVRVCWSRVPAASPIEGTKLSKLLCSYCQDCVNSLLLHYHNTFATFEPQYLSVFLCLNFLTSVGFPQFLKACVHLTLFPAYTFQFHNLCFIVRFVVTTNTKSLKSLSPRNSVWLSLSHVANTEKWQYLQLFHSTT